MLHLRLRQRQRAAGLSGKWVNLNAANDVMAEASARVGTERAAGAWDFERLNRRYARHLKILDERLGGALRNNAAAKALLRWAAAER